MRQSALSCRAGNAYGAGLVKRVDEGRLVARADFGFSNRIACLVSLPVLLNPSFGFSHGPEAEHGVARPIRGHDAISNPVKSALEVMVYVASIPQ